MVKIFRDSEEPEIKLKQASKRDRTLLNIIGCLISGQTTARCGLTEMRRGKRKSAEKTSVIDPDGPEIFSNFPAHDLNFHGK